MHLANFKLYQICLQELSNSQMLLRSMENFLSLPITIYWSILFTSESVVGVLDTFRLLDMLDALSEFAIEQEENLKLTLI